MIPIGVAVEQTKAQIAEYRRFRKRVQELIELNVQICDRMSGRVEQFWERRAHRHVA